MRDVKATALAGTIRRYQGVHVCVQKHGTEKVLKSHKLLYIIYNLYRLVSSSALFMSALFWSISKSFYLKSLYNTTILFITCILLDRPPAGMDSSRWGLSKHSHTADQSCCPLDVESLTVEVAPLPAWLSSKQKDTFSLNFYRATFVAWSRGIWYWYLKNYQL